MLMIVRLSVLSLLAALFAVRAQAQLPPDIHPSTLSRLPPVTAADLDEAGRQHLAENPDLAKRARPGPTQFGMYGSPDNELGIPDGDRSPLGARNFQLAVLIIARELDQEYEWSSHAAAGLRQGLEQSVIDVVKFNRDVAGLAEKDATLIMFGRTLMRDKGVSRELWQKMIEQFGRQRTVQFLQTMAAYLRVGFMLNAVDQQVPPDRTQMLPPLPK
jgi:hypothetical protein